MVPDGSISNPDVCGPPGLLRIQSARVTPPAGTRGSGTSLDAPETSDRETTAVGRDSEEKRSAFCDPA